MSNCSFDCGAYGECSNLTVDNEIRNAPPWVCICEQGYSQSLEFDILNTHNDILRSPCYFRSEEIRKLSISNLVGSVLLTFVIIYYASVGGKTVSKLMRKTWMHSVCMVLSSLLYYGACLSIAEDKHFFTYFWVTFLFSLNHDIVNMAFSYSKADEFTLMAKMLSSFQLVKSAQFFRRFAYHFKITLPWFWIILDILLVIAIFQAKSLESKWLLVKIFMSAYFGQTVVLHMLCILAGYSCLRTLKGFLACERELNSQLGRQGSSKSEKSVKYHLKAEIYHLCSNIFGACINLVPVILIWTSTGFFYFLKVFIPWFQLLATYGLGFGSFVVLALASKADKVHSNSHVTKSVHSTNAPKKTKDSSPLKDSRSSTDKKASEGYSKSQEGVSKEEAPAVVKTKEAFPRGRSSLFVLATSKSFVSLSLAEIEVEPLKVYPGETSK